MGDQREPGLAARGPRLTHLLLHRAWTVHNRRCGRRRVMMARIAVVAAASRSSARPLERSRGVRSTGKTVLVFEFELLRRVVQTASKHRSFVKTRAHTASAPRTPRRSSAHLLCLPCNVLLQWWTSQIWSAWKLVWHVMHCSEREGVPKQLHQKRVRTHIHTWTVGLGAEKRGSP